MSISELVGEVYLVSGQRRRMDVLEEWKGRSTITCSLSRLWVQPDPLYLCEEAMKRNEPRWPGKGTSTSPRDRHCLLEPVLEYCKLSENGDRRGDVTLVTGLAPTRQRIRALDQVYSNCV